MPFSDWKKHGVPSEKYTNPHVRRQAFRIPGPLHDKDHTYKVPKDSAWVKQLRWKEAVSNLLGSLDWLTHQDAVKSTTTSLSPASARTASKSALFSMERTMVHAIQTERNNASNGTAAKKIKELTALVGYALLSLELEDACVRETMYSIFFSLRRLLKYKRSLRLVIRTRRIIRWAIIRHGHRHHCHCGF